MLTIGWVPRARQGLRPAPPKTYLYPGVSQWIEPGSVQALTAQLYGDLTYFWFGLAQVHLVNKTTHWPGSNNPTLQATALTCFPFHMKTCGSSFPQHLISPLAPCAYATGRRDQLFCTFRANWEQTDLARRDNNNNNNNDSPSIHFQYLLLLNCMTARLYWSLPLPS